jgi:hypothetical protein
MMFQFGTVNALFTSPTEHCRLSRNPPNRVPAQAGRGRRPETD